MIDTVLNLLFVCPHRHLTRPFSPINHAGGAHGETYVVCLDCAKQFAYDLSTMQIGKPIGHFHEASVVQTKMSHPHMIKVKYALAGVGLSLALLLGSKLARTISKLGKSPEQST